MRENRKRWDTLKKNKEQSQGAKGLAPSYQKSGIFSSLHPCAAQDHFSCRLWPWLLIFLLISGCFFYQDKEKKLLLSSEESFQPLFLHSFFDFTASDISQRLEELPPAAQKNPIHFLSLCARILSEDSALFFLVDKTHPLPKNFVPARLKSLADFPELGISQENFSLDSRVIPALSALFHAAQEENIRLDLTSTYRSYDYQEKLFSYYAEHDGERAAERYAARAGQSQHQLGTTVDFGSGTGIFAESEASQWMVEKGGQFGWSLSYPEGWEHETGYIGESWHWRWLGISMLRMQELYFNGLQHHLLHFWNSNAPLLKQALRYQK